MVYGLGGLGGLRGLRDFEGFEGFEGLGGLGGLRGLRGSGFRMGVYRGKQGGCKGGWRIALMVQVPND